MLIAAPTLHACTTESEGYVSPGNIPLQLHHRIAEPLDSMLGNGDCMRASTTGYVKSELWYNGRDQAQPLLPLPACPWCVTCWSPNSQKPAHMSNGSPQANLFSLIGASS